MELGSPKLYETKTIKMSIRKIIHMSLCNYDCDIRKLSSTDIATKVQHLNLSTIHFLKENLDYLPAKIECHGH